MEPWSKTIKRRRLSWVGRMMRLDDSTPVRKAVNEATRKAGKKKRGNFKTWTKVVNDLGSIDSELCIDGYRLEQMISDINEWNGKSNMHSALSLPKAEQRPDRQL